MLVVIIPLLTLLSVEGGLRIFDVGVPAGFTHKQKVGSETRITSNPFFTWRFFEPQLARQGSHFSLPLKKGEGTYRVFVLGGSAAQGTPEPAYGMSRMLEVMLRDQYPAVDFEVINGAITAINSHVVLPIARACSKLESDLFVIYLGNNEVVGPYGAGTVFSPLVSSLPMIRAGIALKATRLGQLVPGIAEKIRGRDRRQPGSWDGMSMFLSHQVGAGNPGLETVYHHFERNLADICQTAQRSGIPAIVSTVGVNLKDSPPFAFLHRPGLSGQDLQVWEEMSREGETFRRQGDWSRAIEHLLEVEKLDPDHSELQYRIAGCYWQMGDFAEAKVRYVKALERDSLRFRADTRINEIIRRVAGGKAAEKIHLVDSLKTIEANSPHQTPGKELFYEHVHLNFHGTYVVTRGILEKVQQVLPAWVSRQGSGRPVLSEAACARRLAYTGWDRLKIAEGLLGQMRKPPFTNQLYAEEAATVLSAEVASLKTLYAREEEKQSVLAQYTAAMDGDHTHWRLHDSFARFLYEGLGDPRKAEKHWREAMKARPQSPEAHSQLAKALSALGNHPESLKHHRIALTYDPQSSSGLTNLGAELLRGGRSDRALPYLAQAIDIDPQNAMAHSNLGVALTYTSTDPGTQRQALWHLEKAVAAKPDLTLPRENLAAFYAKDAKALLRSGKKERARKRLEQAVGLVPEAVTERYNLAALVNEAGDQVGAARHLTAVLKTDPEHKKAREGLALIYSRQGTVLARDGYLQEARTKLQRTVDLIPDMADAHYNLAKVLGLLGRQQESAHHLKEALRIDPGHRNARDMARRDLPMSTLPPNGQ